MQPYRPLPTVIGPTENALRALLSQLLSATEIRTYPAWVTLNMAANAGNATSGTSWRTAVADALKVRVAEVEEIVDQLHSRGLLAKDGSLTEIGMVELASGRVAVSATTAQLVEGVSEQEQATVRLVLDRIRHKAEELLLARV